MTTSPYLQWGPQLPPSIPSYLKNSPLGVVVTVRRGGKNLQVTLDCKTAATIQLNGRNISN